MNETLYAAALFAFVSSVTPGPNNMMILASGMNFGIRRSLPHWLGIGIGFAVMVLLVGLGLHALLQRWPTVYAVMQWVSVAYLLWLAWKLAHAEAPSAKGPSAHGPNAPAREAQPMGFWAAAAFQWVNPKAWIMAVTATSAYLPVAAAPLQVLGLAVLFLVINLPSVSVWMLGGNALRRVLQNPSHRRAFNIVMAVALVGSLYPVFVKV